jgi:mannose-6-phosphate isomerase-like protein (cupin superfamily)
MLPLPLTFAQGAMDQARGGKSFDLIANRVLYIWAKTDHQTHASFFFPLS